MMCFEYVEAVCWYVVIVIVFTSSNKWEFHSFRVSWYCAFFQISEFRNITSR